jgi:hypothetical protein
MQARIESDLKAAMKSGDKKRVGTLRLVLSALKNEKIHAQRELTGEEAEAILRRGVKQRKESIDMYEKGGRSDLAQTMPDSELEDTLKAIIAEKGFTSGKDAGLLMKELMARHRGRVDGKRAQETARKLLP